MRTAIIGNGPVGQFLAQRFGVEPLDRGVLPAHQTEVVFLAVPDDAIAHLASELRDQGEWALVHCSGAKSLADLGAGGAAVWHPMRAFPRSCEIAADLHGAVVGLRGDPELVSWLEAETRAWAGEPVRIDEEHAVMIHAACCFAAGLSASVALHAQRLMESAGMTSDQARTAVTRLGSGAVEQGLQGKGLTGPAVRGDLETIRAHLAELGPLAELYRHLTLSLAAHQALDPEVERHLSPVD